MFNSYTKSGIIYPYIYYTLKLFYLFIIPRNATCTDFGKGGHCTATFVTIPNVPSEPINRCLR